MVRLPFYYCGHCKRKHQETTKENYAPILDGQCSARYRQDGGGWRSCHAPFKVFGGPERLGPSQLCSACWDRIIIQPAYGNPILGQANKKGLKEVAKGLHAKDLIPLLPQDLQDVHEKTKGET